MWQYHRLLFSILAEHDSPTPELRFLSAALIASWSLKDSQGSSSEAFAGGCRASLLPSCQLWIPGEWGAMPEWSRALLVSDLLHAKAVGSHCTNPCSGSSPQTSACVSWYTVITIVPSPPKIVCAGCIHEWSNILKFLQFQKSINQAAQG